MRFSIAVIIGLLSVTDAKYSCATPEEFASANKDILEEFKTKFDLKNVSNSKLLKAMYDKRTIIERNSQNITIIELGDYKVEVNRMEFEKDEVYSDIKKYYEDTRNLCEIEPNVPSSSFSACKADYIFKFYACVDEGKVLYHFQEYVSFLFDLDDQRILESYYVLSGKAKLYIMLNIIYWFKKIHQRNIVHGHISPFNIVMKKPNFKQFQIIGFEQSGVEGQKLIDPDFYYLPPDKRDSPTLSVDNDIYALAVTFATMELSMRQYMRTKMDPKCFGETKDRPAKCINLFREGVLGAFNSDNETDKLRGVIKKAISEKKKDRFDTMEKFEKALMDLEKELTFFVKTKNPKDMYDDRSSTTKFFDKISGFFWSKKREYIIKENNIRILTGDEGVASKVIL